MCIRDRSGSEDAQTEKNMEALCGPVGSVPNLICVPLDKGGDHLCQI